MASSALSEIILFVTVLIIAAFVAGVLLTSSYKISIGIGEKTDVLSEKLSQDFEIVNDPSNIPRDSNLGITTLYIKNTGNTQLPITKNSYTVIIDGLVVPIENVDNYNNPGSNVLYPGDVGIINVSYNNSGYHKIKVVLYSGLSREIIGYIP
ncbi:flagellin [Methanocaldococcus infernus ME]|uniref:Flagellin n=1 Tax=Methanocaldococcus infernus (strain DSM 11812 / JCM 15783 / ME) TaxID=573063 RepID=D5VT56_METIM|nr:flagellar protein G [Methanocaldococcus infernus]ADG13759.1 flagellin [Methanocaldococcus infernus ME]